MTAPDAINGSATIPIESNLQANAIMSKSSLIQTIEQGGFAISILSTKSVVHNDIAGNLSTSLVTTDDFIDLPDTQLWVGNVLNRPEAISISGDAGLSNTGVLTITDNVITLDKLTNLSSGTIIVGNISNRPEAISISGDAGLSNTGVLTIMPEAITPTKINIYSAGVPSDASGTQGEIQFNDTNLYVCITSAVLGTGAVWMMIDLLPLSV